MSKLICEDCGKTRRFSNESERHETLRRYQKRRPYCQSCSNKRGAHNSGRFGSGEEPWNKGKPYRQIQWDKHPLFKYGERRYRQRLIRMGRDSKCELCGFNDNFSKKTHVHHRDRDRKNNELSNLQVLCTTCHQNLHKNWEKRLWRPIKKSVA